MSASSLALVCVDPEDPDETRRECLLRRLNRGIRLAEDIGLAFGTLLTLIFVKIRNYNLFQISLLDQLLIFVITNININYFYVVLYF